MERYKIRSRWVKMLSRCEDKDNPQYHDYGGRGIYVCEKWREFENFYLWTVSVGLTKEMQVDRIDNNGPYSPDNCRVCTRSENGRNKRNNAMLTAFGETKGMSDWAEDSRCAVSYRVLLQRRLRGWPDEKAIVTARDDTRKSKTPHNASTLTAFGEEKSISEWLRDERTLCNNHKVVWERIRRGWSPEKALSEPPRDNGRRK